MGLANDDCRLYHHVGRSSRGLRASRDLRSRMTLSKGMTDRNMTIETQKYIRKPLYVDAVRVTVDNFEDIATWCQGEIRQDETPGSNKRYIKVRVQYPMNPRQTKAFVGDWILYTDRGYKVYLNKAFQMAFDETVDTGSNGNTDVSEIEVARIAAAVE